MIEFAVVLLEALVAVALERVLVSNDAGTLAHLRQEVKSLTNTVIGLQKQIQGLDDIVQHFLGNVPDEIRRFRTVRESACSQLGRFDPTLINFATELVASLLEHQALGFQLKVHATKQSLDRASGYEQSDFEVVMGASDTVAQNLKRLGAFFDHLTAFNDVMPMSKLEKPAITLNMVGASGAEFKPFELMRYRIALHMVSLNSMALNWNSSSLGSLKLNGKLLSAQDDCFFKYIKNTGIDTDVHVARFPRSFSTDEYNRLSQLLRDSTEESVSCFKVLVLSFDDWLCETSNFVEHDSFSEKIRTFTEGSSCCPEQCVPVRCVEVNLHDYSHWDQINLEQVLFWGLSMSVVVIRFACLNQLKKIIAASTQITVKYPGLTDDVERVLYVETSSTDNVRQIRNDIKRMASTRRFRAPRDEEDILLEKSYTATEEMMKYIRDRAVAKRSIVNSDVTDESRDLMTSITRIFNRELVEAEANEETCDIMNFLEKIKKTRFSSKLDIYKDDSEMVISNGDQNAGFLLKKQPHMYDEDYSSFRCVPRNTSVNLRLLLRLDGVSRSFQYSFHRKWRAIDDIVGLHEDEKLYVAVVKEEKKTMSKAKFRSRGPIVSSVTIRGVGGTDLDHYRHGKLLQCVMHVAELQSTNAGWTALRVLLKLIPQLAEFCRSESQVVRTASTSNIHGCSSFRSGPRGPAWSDWFPSR
ncbi:hypothetical protein FGB62_98g044 [Gracilaria domingensis]|nr:hypothetical protein FGB62_98g044 [Gracilaria domingensis]